MGIVFGFPYIFWEFWRFIKPGLYPDEKKAARGVVFVCSFLFITGVCFGYFIISPFAITFLVGYDLGAISTPSLASYVDYMTMFTLPVGIVFELPVVVYFLTKIGLVTPSFLKSYRKHAFVIIIILAAVITPPDVITQFLVGIPLYILYEISIVISKRVVAKQEAQEEKEEKEAKEEK
ncbi:MAG: sec-independent protein translocase protein TatC [Saprospiraceae bacterium]